ncbi:MAG: hypothetical protein PHV34_19625 [Verrucomicrobiae bacterium]|nr:hypothetical protein [Verrucomicrobiae bacterium]
MNETETRAEHIDPALKVVGWNVVEGSKILREYCDSSTMTPLLTLWRIWAIRMRLENCLQVFRSIFIDRQQQHDHTILPPSLV